MDKCIERKTMNKKCAKVRKNSKLKLWLSFPQFRLFCVITILSIIMLIMALIVQDVFWSSIYANVFAGFVTGLVLFLLTGTRQIYIAQQEEQLQWLRTLESYLLKYMPLHNQFLHNKPEGDERFNALYDILCIGNDVLEYLKYDPGNKQIGFTPKEYCANKYDINIDDIKIHSEELHDKLKYGTLPENNRKAWEWFEAFDKDLRQLYQAVHHDIESKEIRYASVKRSII